MIDSIQKFQAGRAREGQERLHGRGRGREPANDLTRRVLDGLAEHRAAT